jgi:hypothetical protein
MKSVAVWVDATKATQGDDRHARHQGQVRQKVQARAVLDHQ